MAFAIEWSNPIFYLNLGGFIASLVALPSVLRRRDEIAGGWVWFWSVMSIGTGLHFIGDMFGFPETSDHILIHAVVLLALLGAVAAVRRED